jgi:hypothetical protein
MSRKLELSVLLTLILAIIAFAFWLGGMNTQLQQMVKTVQDQQNKQRGEQGAPGLPGQISVIRSVDDDDWKDDIYGTDLPKLTAPALLFITGYAVSQRKATAATGAGETVSIEIDNKIVAANHDFEGQSKKGTFSASTTVCRELSPGDHRLQIKRHSDSATRQTFKVN